MSPGHSEELDMVRRCLKCMKEFQIPQGYEKVRCTCPYCGYMEGTPPKEANHLYPGTLLQNRYQIGVVVGFGGFGITYKAWDWELGIVVAIKEYYPSGVVTREPGNPRVIVYEGSHSEEYQKGLDRFLEEARRTAQFHSSRYIVQVKNFFRENDTAYLVMEYLEGISLKQYLRQVGTLSLKDAIHVTDSVIEALKEMHGAGILHRDIGPGNIFLCGNDVKIIDFGAARLSDAEREVTRSIVLTPGFAPPEQYQTKSKQGPWTDIYALAATMYNMLTGIRPDESSDRMIEDLVEDVSELNPDVPTRISNAVMKGMAINPELRFRKVEDFADAIHEKTVVDSPKREVKKRKRKRILQITAIVAVLAAVLTVAGIFYFREYRKTHLEKASISVWLPYGEGETAEEAEERFRGNITYFTGNYSMVGIDLVMIPETEYKQKITEAAKEDRLPSVYLLDGLGDAGLEYAESLENVYAELSMEDYIYLKAYRNVESGTPKSLPTAVDVPAAYIRRSNEVDPDNVTVSSFEQLSKVPSAGYYISSDNFPMMIASMGGSYGYNGKLVLDTAAENLVAEIAKSEYPAETEEKALEAFRNGEITYYLGGVRDYDKIKSMAGLYQVKGVYIDKYYATPCDRWCMRKGLPEAEKAAAERFLIALLSKDEQVAMYVLSPAGGAGVPLNREALGELTKLDEQLGFLSDYMEHLKVEIKDFDGERESTMSMIGSVIVKKEKTIREWLED